MIVFNCLVLVHLLRNNKDIMGVSYIKWVVFLNDIILKAFYCSYET